MVSAWGRQQTCVALEDIAFTLGQGPCADAVADGAVDQSGAPGPGWAAPATHRAQVHQATGMISVPLDVDLAEALVRLRCVTLLEIDAAALMPSDQRGALHATEVSAALLRA